MGANVTSPTFHTHLGSAAISYLLQPAPDGEGAPAPSLEDRLEVLRGSEWTGPIEASRQLAGDLFQAVSAPRIGWVILNSRPTTAAPRRFLARLADSRSRGQRDRFHDHRSRLATDFTVETRGSGHDPIGAAPRSGRRSRGHSWSQHSVARPPPVFIDFAWSGPGHPLVDLGRLDAVVRSTAMRMLSDKRSMQEVVQAIYIDGTPADAVLAAHRAIAASPSASLAVRTAAKIRQSALVVAQVHSLGLPDFLAMTSVVAAHVLAIRHSGSGIERLVLSVVGPEFLAVGHS